MSFSFRDLHSKSDEELENAHDAAAMHTQVGVDYYLDELHRRETQRSMEASTELARRAYWMTVANTLLALIAVAIALLK